MNKKSIIKTVVIVGILGVTIGGATAAYMFFMPHRDVQAVSTDFSLTSDELVSEYLKDATAANARYLDVEGESKVLEVSGMVASVSVDYNGNKVVVIKGSNAPAGVSCTMLPTAADAAAALSVGQTVRVKGVIRAGAAYDEDLEMYENVILDKCALVL